MLCDHHLQSSASFPIDFIAPKFETGSEVYEGDHVIIEYCDS